jgi:NAD(P)H dehydrogenase (quinone)
MDAHFETEDLITASGLNYTIFRNVLYMDALPVFLGEAVFEQGIQLPIGQGKAPYALRSDMAEAIANVLLEDDCGRKIYTFTGTEAYTMQDVAAALSRLTGKVVTYTPLETAVFEAQLRERGVPDLVVPRIVGFLTDIRNGQEEEVSPNLERWLGRPPTTLAQGLKTLFKR